jgi:hypothetical protein
MDPKSSCIACPQGMFSSSNGWTSCQFCTTGLFSNSGSSSCLMCNAGSFNNVTGQSGCISCPIGKFSQAGFTKCDICAAGLFNNIAGKSVCPSCSPGKFSSQVGSSDCALSTKGSFSFASAPLKCDLCPIGKYASLDGQSICIECPNGTFVDTTGSSTCFPCRKGRFSNVLSAKMVNCQPCPLSYFANDTGLPLCYKCDPFRDTSSEGSTDQSACICQEGYYGDILIDTCRPCSQGAAFKCPSGSLIPWIGPGYYRAGPNGEAANIAYICSPTSACAKTESQSFTTCGEGYTGYLCGECSERFYKFSGVCKGCPSDAVKWFSIMAVVLILIALIWRLMDQKTQIPTDVRVIVQALQIIALFPNISVKWPKFLITLFQVFSILVSYRCPKGLISNVAS